MCERAHIAGHSNRPFIDVFLLKAVKKSGRWQFISRSLLDAFFGRQWRFPRWLLLKKVDELYSYWRSFRPQTTRFSLGWLAKSGELADNQSMEKYAVYIGGVALDEYYRAGHWPGVKEKVLVDALPAVPGGMIANAACVASRLGTKVKFVAELNSGSISQFLLSDLRGYGVDTQMVHFDDSLPDPKTMIFLTDNEHTILIPRLGWTKIEFSEDDLVVLEGAAYLYSTPIEFSICECCGMRGAELLQYLRSKGVKIVIDLDVNIMIDESFDVFRNYDIIFLNEVGFASVQGRQTPAETIKKLMDLGVELIVVTEAENGCTIYSRDGSFHADGFKVEVVDVTGAGDTFCSSFLHAYFQGKGLRYAAKFANAAASLCVGKLGARAGAVTEAEVESVLSATAG